VNLIKRGTLGDDVLNGRGGVGSHPLDGSSEPKECMRGIRNRRVARLCLRLLRMEFKELSDATMTLPPRIPCGQIRSTIRSVLNDATPLVELSIKTAQKLEKPPCRFCSRKFDEELDRWKESRFQPVCVDEAHLALFKRVVAVFVPTAWNRGESPFIPNGSATLFHSRKEGGNWLEEDESPFCRAELVLSSGKPRIVTLFSEAHSRVLSRLHRSLYNRLAREGWCLRGPPTNEDVSRLEGHDWVSVDYSAATDNIKNAYVRALVDVLIAKGEGLSPEEIRALHVVADPRLVDMGDRQWTRGQPMGSLMSFPMLCLMNRAAVELSVLSLISSGEVEPRKGFAHRCLINGDDCLFRDLTPGRSLYAALRRESAEIGFVVNLQKTMVHASLAEINSTLFKDGRLVKKVNLGALIMKNVSDAAGLSWSACRTVSGALWVLRRNRHVLAMQESKVGPNLPKPFRRLVLSDKLLQPALHSVPSEWEPAPNPFPVVARPVGYNLTPAQERKILEEEVRRLRASGYRPPKGDPPVRELRNVENIPKTRKYHREDNVLQVLARGWEEHEWEVLRDEAINEGWDPSASGNWFEISDLSPIDTLMDRIRAFKTDHKFRKEWQPWGVYKVDHSASFVPLV